MTETIEQTFHALEWHDAVLLKITIDRSTPGERDDVLVAIEWPDGARHDIRFSDCFAFETRMNFGVIAPESIRDAQCIVDSPELREIRQRWSDRGVEVDDLMCFEITTNSTASLIRIFARQFHVMGGQRR